MALDEKARTAVGAAERAEDKAASGQTFSEFDFTTAATNRQHGRIEKILIDGGHIGRENAIRNIALAQKAGYIGGTPRNCVRRLQQEIADEVDATDALIVCDSQGRGYYIAVSREELARYERSLNSRSIRTQKRLRAVRRAQRTLEGQLMLTAGGNTDGRKD